MFNQDYTAKILNLEGVNITNVENIDEELHIYLELPRKEHRCPVCGAGTDRVHDYRMQVVKDVPLGRTTFLHIRKRRYRCSCGKRFFEENTFLPRYYRVTQRVVAKVIQAFKKVIPAKEIGSSFNISGMTAMRYFHYVNHKPKQLPEVLSLDEFKGNSGGHKYNSIIADPHNHEVTDILPSRHEDDLIKYFSQFESKKDVKYFICDMNQHFRRVAKICFKNAVIVADRFHVIRQASWAMDRVRKNEQKKLSARFRKQFKKSKYLTRKSIEKLTPEEIDKLATMLEISPRLAQAYRMKNELMDIVQYGSVDGRARLIQWLNSVDEMDLPEFDDCTKAYRNWFNEILNSMDVPWSNGFIEGCNNKTKVLKRVCYGMRNFRNFKNRILFCHN